MANFNEKLILIDDQNQLMEFLRGPTVAIAEVLTATLSDPSITKLAVGRVVQGALKGKLLEQLGKEIDEHRAAGRIKEDYFATHNQQSTLHELLKFIDETPPDEEVFNALKSIFFCAVQSDAGDEDTLTAYQYLQICKKLDSGDVLLLRACWKLFEADPAYLEKQRAPNSIQMVPHEWAGVMTSVLHLPEELILLHAKKLMEFNLFTDSGTHRIVEENNRLTSFGIALCQHITRF